jgi:phosphoglycerate dehydrogenase-like enzyme
LELFVQSLAPTDRVVMEATGDAHAIAPILAPRVAEVVLADAKRVRAISHARVKTDKIDAKAYWSTTQSGLYDATGQPKPAAGPWVGRRLGRGRRRRRSHKRTSTGTLNDGFPDGQLI